MAQTIHELKFKLYYLIYIYPHAFLEIGTLVIVIVISPSNNNSIYKYLLFIVLSF